MLPLEKTRGVGLFFLVVFFCGSNMSPVDARRHVLEGIHLPLEKMLQYHGTTATTCSESNNNSDNNNNKPAVPLRFNGAGVRSINVFGWDFKVYVAGFYTQTPLQNPEAVFETAFGAQQQPMQLDFTFLRSVNQAKVTQAWTEQLAHSVDKEAADYEGYEQDRDTFIGAFGPIENGGTETVVLLEDGRTVVVDQGVQKAVIEGQNFQRAFLSVWFGHNAVSPDLKEGLLGKIGHFGLQHHDAAVAVEA